MAELDQAFELTSSGNAEIVHQWLLIAIRNDYLPTRDRLERYLLDIGRRKLVLPLYQAMAETADGRSLAMNIYRQARPGYHPITANSVDAVLGWSE